MQEHYGKVKASQQAGAVTYFAFLSFFPILALAFFVVGWIAKVYPDASDDLVDADRRRSCPDLVGNDEGQISIDEHPGGRRRDRGSSVSLGVLYAGLGWLSAMRDALMVVFEQPGDGAARTS